MPIQKMARCALSIAGSDSCGGAGIQADLKTFSAFGIHGATVISSVTAQNTLGVFAAETVSTEVLTAQLRAVLEDLPVKAIKTGMLPEPDGIEEIAQCLRKHGAGIPLIVDPVLQASSGSALGGDASMAALTKHLFPLATLITPNLLEASALTGTTVRTRADMKIAGKLLLEFGSMAVLMKGGHLGEKQVTDILLTHDGLQEYSHKRFPETYHGTGCTLSAAIAANLARDRSLAESVELAVDYVQRCIASAIQPQKGNIKLLGFSL